MHQSDDLNVSAAVESLLSPKKQYIKMNENNYELSGLGYALLTKIDKYMSPLNIVELAYQQINEMNVDLDKVLKNFHAELKKYVIQFRKKLRSSMKGTRKCKRCRVGYMVYQKQGNKGYRCSNFDCGQ